MAPLHVERYRLLSRLGSGGMGDVHAMEYVEGETLRDRIAHGPLSASDVIDIALQLFDALEEATVARWTCARTSSPRAS